MLLLIRQIRKSAKLSTEKLRGRGGWSEPGIFKLSVSLHGDYSLTLSIEPPQA